MIPSHLIPKVSLCISYDTYGRDGSSNEDRFSEVTLGGLCVYRFYGDDHKEKATEMADELNDLIQKYVDMEVR
jgi:hypothetical protein